MPTYAYQCESCGAEIEVIQKMSDAPLTKCQSCGGKLQKKMFPVGIMFKGPGFYVNDYASKGRGASSTTSAPSARTDSKTSTKSETVSAPAKTEVKTPAAAASKS